MTRDPRHDPYPGDALLMPAGDIVLVCSVDEDTSPTSSLPPFDLVVEWCNGAGHGLMSVATWRSMLSDATVVRVAPMRNVPPSEFVS